MNALIVSFKFNPGHFSHLKANCELFKKCEIIPYLLVHPRFNNMFENQEIKIYNSIFEIFKAKKNFKIAFILFPSINNIFLLIFLKFLNCKKIIYLFHEPFESFHIYLDAGFSKIKATKISLISLINVITVYFSDLIILPSKKAKLIYENKYLLVNKNNEYIPLIFDDELVHKICINDKSYISYIGTIAKDHAFDAFLNFALHCCKNNHLSQFTFLIATSSTLDIIRMSSLEEYIEKGKFIIWQGTPIPNNVINLYYFQSLVVWNAYNRSMQSGVLSKSFMFGTPVLANSKNENEYIENHKNSIILSNNNDFDEIESSILEIINNIEIYSKNSRNSFLKFFFFENYIYFFKNLITQK